MKPQTDSTQSRLDSETDELNVELLDENNILNLAKLFTVKSVKTMMHFSQSLIVSTYFISTGNKSVSSGLND